MSLSKQDRARDYHSLKDTAIQSVRLFSVSVQTGAAGAFIDSNLHQRFGKLQKQVFCKRRFFFCPHAAGLYFPYPLLLLSAVDGIIID